MLAISIQREIKSREDEPTNYFKFNAVRIDTVEYNIVIVFVRHGCVVCTFAVYWKSEFQMYILNLSPMNAFA